MLLNGNSYKTVLLDTNVLHKLVNDRIFAGKLLTRFCLQQPISIFCFSIYNVIELRGKTNSKNGNINLYASFVDFFSKFPCLMFFPYKCLIHAEYTAYISNRTVAIDRSIANVFSPVDKKYEYIFSEWIDCIFKTDSGAIEKLVAEELHDMPSIAADWQNMRSMTPILSQQFERIRQTQEPCLIRDFLKTCGLSVDSSLNIKKFPAARTMLFSQTQRVHFTSKTLVSNDVMDVMISSFALYVDTVITEAGQADTYKKAKKQIPQLGELEILSIREII